MMKKSPAVMNLKMLDVHLINYIKDVPLIVKEECRLKKFDPIFIENKSQKKIKEKSSLELARDIFNKQEIFKTPKARYQRLGLAERVNWGRLFTKDRTCVICKKECVGINSWCDTLCCSVPYCHDCCSMAGYTYGKKKQRGDNYCLICDRGYLFHGLNYYDFVDSELTSHKTYTSLFLEGMKLTAPKIVDGIISSFQWNHETKTDQDNVPQFLDELEDDVFLPGVDTKSKPKMQAKCYAASEGFVTKTHK